MPKLKPAADLERRKKVRIRIRGDLDIAPQKYEGRTYYVVKDPVSLRYWRFREDEHYLIRLMDGVQTLDDAQKQYETKFRPSRLPLEDLESFAQQLLNAGLAQNEAPSAGKQLFDQRKKRLRSEWMQVLTNILYIKIPLYDPDKLLVKMLPYFRWLFTIWFTLASCALWAAAIMLVLTHFEAFRDKLPSYQQFFTFKNLIYMWFALGVVKVIHEFGHGLSCKAFGGEVHEMGLLFLVLSPALYCNVSDSWTLPNKWKRIIISAAGIWVELVIAAAATFVWWNSASHPFINNVSLNLMVVCSVSTVLFNANPLMRYDGYYVLADLLEIPNLRDRSNKYLQRLFMEHCMGVEMQPEQYMELWRRILFVFYAIVSYIYRWVITFSILWFMYSFLKPYKLGAISAMLALGAAGSMVGWPLYRTGKNLYKRGRFPDMKRVRVSVTTGVFVAVLAFFFFVPLPVARVRQTGVVQVQPEFIDKVVVTVSGILERLDVRDGQIIPEDGYRLHVLATLKNLDLDNKLADAETKAKISDEDKRASDRRVTEARDVNDKARARQDLEKAINDYKTQQGYIKAYTDMQQKLVLRAPRSGVVMSPPHVDEIGKYVEDGQTLCSIGDPRHLRVLLPLPTVDYHLLKRDWEEVKKNGGDLEVVIRVKGRGSKTWKGRIRAESFHGQEAKEVPEALTDKAGGPVVVKPGMRPNVHVPQSQIYLVAVDFEDTDLANVPGALAQVKIHCRWRTCAWWVWRTISATFDLGLI